MKNFELCELVRTGLLKIYTLMCGSFKFHDVYDIIKYVILEI